MHRKERKLERMKMVVGVEGDELEWGEQKRHDLGALLSGTTRVTWHGKARGKRGAGKGEGNASGDGEWMGLRWGDVF